MKLEETVPMAGSENGAGVQDLPGSQTEPSIRRSTSNSFKLDKTEPQSTDSEDAKKPPTVSTRPSSVGPVECPVAGNHEGRELLNVVIALPVDQVFTLIFVHQQFMIDIYSNKKTYDVTSTQWQSTGSGQEKTRQLTYTMTLPPNNLGPKVSYVTEDQTVLSQTVLGEVYVVDTEVKNQGVPYSDSFYVYNHYCLTKETDKTTRLTIRVLVKYKKSVWGMIKTMIEKNTYAGVEDFLTEVSLQLSQEAEREIGGGHTTGRKRRTKRVTNVNDKKKVNSSVLYREALQKKDTTDTSREGSPLALIAVCFALVILGSANVILFYRLNSLDKMAQETKMEDLEFPSLKYLGIGGSWEAVARILHKQEAFHEDQMGMWKETATQATNTLKQIEQSLESVLISIPDHRANLLKRLEESALEISRSGWVAQNQHTDLPVHLQLQHLQDKYHKLNHQNDFGENKGENTL